MLLRLRREIATLPRRERTAGRVLVDRLEAEHGAARAEMLAALDDPRYTALLDRLAEAFRSPLPTPPATLEQPALIELPRAEFRKLRRDVEQAGADPADEVLHALRIRAKRVRYTGELVQPALRRTRAGRAVKRLLTATAGLQDVLGEHQDACVAEQRIRELLDGLGETIDAHVVFVAGRLVEREHAKAEANRADWQSAWAEVAASAAHL
jgi:CHAD domain-containing protein